MDLRSKWKHLESIHKFAVNLALQCLLHTGFLLSQGMDPSSSGSYVLRSHLDGSIPGKGSEIQSLLLVSGLEAWEQLHKTNVSSPDALSSQLAATFLIEKEMPCSPEGLAVPSSSAMVGVEMVTELL